MALTGALCLNLFATTGVTNKSLRAVTARLLGTPYSASQMTYDLRRLRANGLIRRIDHTHAYLLTPTGNAWPSSTPNSTTACCDHCWPPTNPRHPPTSAKLWPPSTTTSTTTSAEHDSNPQPET
jgi:hypothetical protein